jgi:hypothetical protein
MEGSAVKRARTAKRLDPTRSAVALAARLQTGAGKHGGTARQQNKRDRSVTKRTLRDLDKHSE